jgi:hypothetical protein
MGHLPTGMHAGVRAPASMNFDVLPAKRMQGTLKRLLDRRMPGLHLPAGIGRAIIGHGDPISRTATPITHLIRPP